MSNRTNDRRQANGRFKKNPIRQKSKYNNIDCSLCGLKNHKAAQGYPNIKTDIVRLYKTMSSHNTCSLCPGSKKNILNYPPTLCPLKQGGLCHLIDN